MIKSTAPRHAPAATPAFWESVSFGAWAASLTIRRSSDGAGVGFVVDAGSVEVDGIVGDGASNVGFAIPETKRKERVLMSKDVELVVAIIGVWDVTSADMETRNGTVKLMSASIGEETGLPDMVEETVEYADMSMEFCMARFGVKPGRFQWRHVMLAGRWVPKFESC
jgi:hypothetical protein